MIVISVRINHPKKAHTLCIFLTFLNLFQRILFANEKAHYFLNETRRKRAINAMNLITIHIANKIAILSHNDDSEKSSSSITSAPFLGHESPFNFDHRKQPAELSSMNLS